jgi:hypothetical protein
MELELAAHAVEHCIVCVQRLAQSTHGRWLRLPTVKTKGVIEAPWVHSHHLLMVGKTEHGDPMAWKRHRPALG